ncbi:MAG: acyltransferase [Pyrinomonadaceae bacterium]|nr:acyltransferase [Pyrinomonadaceae bacterium]
MAVSGVVLTHLKLSVGRGGFVGVDLFFVLSGFLITVLLLEEWECTGNINLLAFYRRRAFRLLPALLLLLCVHFLFTLLIPGSQHTILTNEPWVLAYVANWALISGRGLGQLTHAWSLAVEEQFYLGWPLVLVLILRMRHGRRNAATVAIVGTLTAIVVRMVLWDADADIWRIYSGTDARADQVLIGCLLAIAFNAGMLDRLAGRPSRLLGAMGILGLGTIATSNLPWDNPVYDTIGMTGTALLAAFAIIGVLLATDSRLTTALSARPLVRLGAISYGIYLWQTPILELVKRFASTAPPVLQVVLSISLIVGIASASFVLVERPIMAVGRAGRGLRKSGRAVNAPAESVVEETGSSQGPEGAQGSSPLTALESRAPHRFAALRGEHTMAKSTNTRDNPPQPRAST